MLTLLAGINLALDYRQKPQQAKIAGHLASANFDLVGYTKSPLP